MSVLLSRLKVGIWACLGSCIALGGLAGNLTGRPWLTTYGGGFRPMTALSAGFCLALSAGLLLAQAGGRGPYRRVAALLLALGTAALVVHQVTLARMVSNPPLTMLGFFGASLALGAVTAGQATLWWHRQVAALAALIPLCLGGLILFSYAAGIPLLYETERLPTSLPTALILFFLGHGLLALAGTHTFPLALFHLERAERAPSSSLWPKRLPLLGFIALASLCGVGGALLMRAQAGATLRASQAQLAKITTAKAEALDRWLEERFGDAEVIRQSGLVQERLASRLAGTPGDGAIRSWMGSLVEHYHYEHVVLCDPEGRPLVEVGNAPLGSEDPAGLSRALATGKLALVDFHRDPDGSDWHFGFWVPVLDPKGLPVGAVNLTMGVDHFLRPVLDEWPAEGARGLTVLLHHGQGEFQGLWGRQVAPGPVPDLVPFWKAAKAGHQVDLVAGGERLQDRIYGSVCPVRRAPWVLATRIRQADLVAELRPRFWAIAAATLGSILLLAMATGFLVRRHGGLRMRAQLALERDRKILAERAKILMREANDIILVHDLDGRIVEANERAQASYGYSLPELLERSARDLRGPDLSADFQAKWDWLLQQGSGVWETFHRRKDGTVFPVEVSGKVVSLGGETFILSFLRDISERHAQALEIRHLTQLYAALGQVGQVIVWTRERAELFSRICTVLVEFGSLKTAWIGAVEPATQEVLLQCGRGAEDHLGGYAPTEALDLRGAVIRDGMPSILNLVLVGPPGAAQQASAAAFPIAQAGRVSYILGVVAEAPGFFGPGEVELLEETVLDLAFALDKLDEEALRAKVERELATAEGEQVRLEAQLQQSQKMESLGSLAGGVAHDLNNVLGAILSLASAHQTDPALPEAVVQALDIIVNACLRGRGVVKSLLYFARKGLEEEHPLDLNALVRDLAQLLAHTTLKRVTLELDLEEPLPQLLGDGGALSHALMNLCVNAVDAMPRGGTLVLRTRAEGDGSLVLTVVDTGEGMPVEVIQRAMEPFFTTKPVGKGTGLGLSMVFGTMKAHGGTLDLTSTPGQGTTATLRFPAFRTRARTLTRAAAPALAGGGGPGSLTILLVDDDELIRDSVGVMLEVLGHKVRLASGGQEALGLFKGGLQVDLVILDMNMPGMTGAETLPRLLELRPGQRVVMASGYSEQDVTALMAGLPGVQSLRKPFSLAEMQAVLAKVG